MDRKVASGPRMSTAAQRRHLKSMASCSCDSRKHLIGCSSPAGGGAEHDGEQACCSGVVDQHRRGRRVGEGRGGRVSGTVVELT